MRVLVVDVGGTHVKLMHSGSREARKFDSGDGFTPEQVVEGVKGKTADWRYDVVTIGIPSPVLRGAVMEEPWNLGKGWVGFDWAAALGKPVKILNDAAMQALGSYEGGTMLFLGLGTGLGSALIVDGALTPLELAHVPYRGGEYEDYVGLRGYEKYGKRKWRKLVREVVRVLKAGLVADYVVIGGGQTKLLKKAPEGSRLGDNLNAFVGGQRLWDEPARRPPPKQRTKKRKAARAEAAPLEVPATELEPAPEGEGQ